MSHPAPVQSPPAEQFWTKYSPRFELPLSTVAAVLLHVAAGAVIVFVLFRLADQSTDRAAVPLVLIESGTDDAGDSPAPAGGDNALLRGESNPFDAPQNVPDPAALPKAVPDVGDVPAVIEPDGAAAVPDTAGFGRLDKTIQRVAGGTRGNGPGPDSTHARTMRWVLRFSTTDGQDYVDQIRALGGVVLVPVPPENKQLMYFEDLKNPKAGRVATDADLRLLKGLLQFSDGRKESVEGVARVLGLTFTPKAFWAAFPKPVEDELTRKEHAYRNRRAEDIEQTVFTVTVRGGKYEVTVVDQMPKR